MAGTLDRGLTYGRHGRPGLDAGFTDADWGSSKDRKSIGGYAFILNGAAISWVSKKQSTIALSSTEAEYIALVQAVKESLWLQGILSEVGARKHLAGVRNIYVDDQGAIALAKKPEFHPRTKHIDIQYHFIREHVGNGKIELTYGPTGDMTADVFTKALAEPAFRKHSLSLGLGDKSAMEQNHQPDGDEAAYEGQTGASTSEGRYCESLALTHHLPPVAPSCPL